MCADTRMTKCDKGQGPRYTLVGSGFGFSRNNGQVALKIIYFHYLGKKIDPINIKFHNK